MFDIDSLDSGLLMLVNALIGFYIGVLLLRLLLQYFDAYAHNPIYQLVLQLTQPLVKPLQKILPTLWGIDTAIIVLAWVIAMLRAAIPFWLNGILIPPILPIIVGGLGSVCMSLITIYYIGIFLQIIFSWVRVMPDSPLLEVLYWIIEPYLNLFRRVLPTMGGLDLSPLLAILVLQVVKSLIKTLFMGYA